MKKLFILVFILFALTGCSNPTEYQGVENIRVENEMLIWDTVKIAKSYEITINSNITILQTPSYDIIDLNNGSYEVLISIVYDDGHKESIPYSFTIQRNYERPTNLEIVDSILSFTSLIPTTYELYMDNILKATFTDTFIDLSEYMILNRSSEIKVNAIYEQQDYMSEVIIFDGLVSLDLNQTLTYELRSSDTIVINFDHIDEIIFIEIDGNSIDEALYTYTSTSITFDKDIFFYPSYGLNTYTVFTSSGYFTISINVVETENPHLLSTSTVSYEPLNDVECIFNLLDGTFVQLSGVELETTDYSFNNDTLTINASYIESILALYPDREHIILTYQLQKEGNSFIGVIFINL